MTGYVLGHHLNYVPELNQVDVDDASKLNGDYLPQSRRYFHANPQFWTSDEFYKFARQQTYEIRPSIDEEELTVEQLIKETAREQKNWPLPEMADYPARGNQLPPYGVMTHLDYTTYAHAIHIRRMIGRAQGMSIYLDQDEVLRNAYISAFGSQIMMGKVDMATVQFQK
ncbi:MAG: hypothetical protein VX228_02375 [Pseudomonadota bacterium]|nr:hypothetical protein [Pseudomonadota bacterium]